MSETAEHFDEVRSLRGERATMESTIQAVRTDEAGCVQRTTGLERMNHTLEAQVDHVHGRMKHEYDLAIEQLRVAKEHCSSGILHM